MRESYTAVIARNEDVAGDWISEPYETAWAAEGLFFVRILKTDGLVGPATFYPQVSPDGMRWVDEGASMTLPVGQELGFVKLTHFGGWIRVRATVQGTGRLRIMAYLTLKA